jgi:mannitol-1-/sugar-/sorbitol-6-phosphatase
MRVDIDEPKCVAGGQRGLATDATVVVRDLRGLTWHNGILRLAAADLLRS